MRYILPSTLLGQQSVLFLGDKPLKGQVVCPRNGTAVLKKGSFFTLPRLQRGKTDDTRWQVQQQRDWGGGVIDIRHILRHGVRVTMVGCKEPHGRGAHRDSARTGGY